VLLGVVAAAVLAGGFTATQGLIRSAQYGSRRQIVAIVLGVAMVLLTAFVGVYT
jgi:hypothetical protein